MIGGTREPERRACRCAPRRSAATPCCRASSIWSAKAQRSRAPVQRLADHVAGWFVPAVIAAAVLAFAAWAAFGPEPRFAYRAGRCGDGADHRLSLRARAWRRRCRSWSASAAARDPAF